MGGVTLMPGLGLGTRETPGLGVGGVMLMPGLGLGGVTVMRGTPGDGLGEAPGEGLGQAPRDGLGEVPATPHTTTVVPSIPTRLIFDALLAQEIAASRIGDLRSNSSLGAAPSVPAGMITTPA